MSTKGHINRVFRRHGIVYNLPKLVVIDEFKDEPLTVKLYIFRGEFSGRVNDVELPLWFA